MPRKQEAARTLLAAKASSSSVHSPLLASGNVAKFSADFSVGADQKSTTELLALATFDTRWTVAESKKIGTLARFTICQEVISFSAEYVPAGHNFEL